MDQTHQGQKQERGQTTNMDKGSDVGLEVTRSHTSIELVSFDGLRKECPAFSRLASVAEDKADARNEKIYVVAFFEKAHIAVRFVASDNSRVDPTPDELARAAGGPGMLAIPYSAPLVRAVMRALIEFALREDYTQACAAAEYLPGDMNG